MARAGHNVSGCDAARLRLLDAGVAHVNGVQYANVGLNGCTAVAAGRRANVAVRVDKAGHENLPRSIDALGVLRDLCGTGRTGGDDLSALNHQDTIVVFGSTDGDHVSTDNGERRWLGQ